MMITVVRSAVSTLAALALAVGVASCSGSSQSTQAAAASAAPESAQASTAPISQGSPDPAAPATSAAPIDGSSPAEVSSTDGTCPLVGNDTVQAAMSLSVSSVQTNDANDCTFHFKGGTNGDLVVKYSSSGGPDEIDSVRKAGAGVTSIVNFIGTAASAPPGATGVLIATPPPDVQKVGDDQYFQTEGPITQFYAVKGDAYVEVDGGFLPEGVSRWVLFPKIAEQVLSTR